MPVCAPRRRADAGSCLARPERTRRLLALLALALLDNGCVNLGGYTFTPAQDGIIYAGLEDGLDYSLVQIDLASGNPTWTVQLVDGGNLK